MEKIIKNNDGSVNTISFESNDNKIVRLGEEYKLIKLYSGKKNFKDTILGSDIGIHSQGFVSTAIVSLLIAIVSFTFLVLSFKI